MKTTAALTFVFTVVALAVYWFYEPNREPSVIGKEGTLYGGQGGEALVLVDLQAFNDMRRAHDNKDDPAVRALMLSGRVFMVKNGTPVRVTTEQGDILGIRIEGGAKVGATGFTTRHCVRFP